MKRLVGWFKGLSGRGKLIAVGVVAVMAIGGSLLPDPVAPASEARPSATRTTEPEPEPSATPTATPTPETTPTATPTPEATVETTVLEDCLLASGWVMFTDDLEEPLHLLYREDDVGGEGLRLTTAFGDQEFLSEGDLTLAQEAGCSG